MESLAESEWDVVLTDTGLSQSLLALALSRSGKKVLHLDRNDYYGASEAAFSLDEAEEWAASDKARSQGPLHNATAERPPHTSGDAISFSRAYSLSLSPQIIYCRSNLLTALITSRVHQQLEFLAVGTWWICDAASESPLRKVPKSREDVVNDGSIDLRSKRNVMRFLQLAADVDSHASVLEEWGHVAFPDFLRERFKLSVQIHSPLLALTLSPYAPAQTPTSHALPQIHRHLTSTGIFGPGFGAVVPKWGGLAEVAQVCCRAGAVGSGVYVLGKHIEEINIAGRESEAVENASEASLSLRLAGREHVTAKHIVKTTSQASTGSESTAHSISIISSPLDQLFPQLAEGAPPPAVAVVVMPSGSLSVNDSSNANPVILQVHSSDTGECPAGQSVLYGCTLVPRQSQPRGPDAQDHETTDDEAFSLLRQAVQKLLSSITEDVLPRVLWQMHYLHDSQPTSAAVSAASGNTEARVLGISPLQAGTILEDDVLERVKEVWTRIVPETSERGEFMIFPPRQHELENENDDATNQSEDAAAAAAEPTQNFNDET